MLGTLRSLDKDMRALAMKRLKEVVESIAVANGAEATLEFTGSYPITYNDPELFNQMYPTLEKSAGSENVFILNAFTGAEDFSFFQEKVPGMYFFLGGVSEETKLMDSAPHHTPDFFVDDSGMLLGIRTLSNLTLDYMNSMSQSK